MRPCVDSGSHSHGSIHTKFKVTEEEHSMVIKIKKTVTLGGHRRGLPGVKENALCVDQDGR